MEDKKIDFAKFCLHTIHEYIRFADQKAGFLLTLNIAITSAFLMLLPDLIQHYKNLDKLSLLLISLTIFFLISFVLLMHSLKKLIEAINPRLVPATNHKSLLFWEGIKTLGLNDFSQKLENLDVETIVQEFSDQIYNTSLVASAKYQNIKNSIRALQWAVVFALLSLLLKCYL